MAEQRITKILQNFLIFSLHSADVYNIIREDLGKGKNFYGGSIPPERGMKMNLKEKIQFVSKRTIALSDGYRRALGCYKSMLRNIAEEGGLMGGEAHVQPEGLKQFECFLDKCILAIKENKADAQ